MHKGNSVASASLDNLKGKLRVPCTGIQTKGKKVDIYSHMKKKVHPL